jgi:hypothetical protein
VPTLGAARRVRVAAVTPVGPDLRVEAHVEPVAWAPEPARQAPVEEVV